jgi:hypothetical protein
MTFVGTNIEYNQDIFSSLIKVENLQIYPTSCYFQVNNIVFEKNTDIKYILINLVNKENDSTYILHYIKDASYFIKNNVINIPMNIILFPNYYIDISTNIPNILMTPIYTNITFSNQELITSIPYINEFNHILSSKHELNIGYNSINLNIDYMYCNLIYIYVKHKENENENENIQDISGNLYINEHCSHAITKNLCGVNENSYICDFYKSYKCNGNKFIDSKLNIISNVTGYLYITYLCPNFINYNNQLNEMKFIDLIYYNLELESDNEEEEEDEDGNGNGNGDGNENGNGTITERNRNLIISTFFVDLFNSDSESNKINNQFTLYKNLILNYEKETAIKLNENNITCSITFDQINNNEYYYKCTQCNNSFSMDAFKQWIEEQSATCPMCRLEFKTYPQLNKIDLN